MYKSKTILLNFALQHVHRVNAVALAALNDLHLQRTQGKQGTAVERTTLFIRSVQKVSNGLLHDIFVLLLTSMGIWSGVLVRILLGGPSFVASPVLGLHLLSFSLYI